MKLKDFIAANNALSQLAMQPMNVKSSYFVTKNLRLMEPEMKVFDEARRKILDKFPIGEDGKPDIPKDKEEFVNSEFEELINIEMDPKFYTMKLSDLAFEITPSQLNAIFPLLEDI